MSRRVPVSDTPTPVTVEPGAIYGQIQKQVDDTQKFLYYVVAVLLVMVATLLIMVLLDWKNSNEHILERMSAGYMPVLATTSTPAQRTVFIVPSHAMRVWGSEDYLTVQ